MDAVHSASESKDTREPSRLQRGRDFERRVRSKARNASGVHHDSVILHEEVIVIDGRRRRVDMLLDVDPEGNEQFAVVLEMKSCDWSSMSEKRVRRNICRHAGQVLRYVDGCVSVLDMNAAAGILYEWSPADPATRELIEEYHDARGVQVIWADRPEGREWV